jgi:hypothetical protein
MTVRNLTEAGCHFGGVVGTARWQGHVEQLEKPSSPHQETGGERRSYNRRKPGSRLKAKRWRLGP